MSTVRDGLRSAAQQLRTAGVANADREATWLLAHLLGCSAGMILARMGEVLTPDQETAYASLVERRANREPLQYILGTEEFMGMIFRVNPSVLIPRLDTEVVVRETAARLTGAVRVADIGTGSGAIAIGLASLLPEAKVVAVDISEEALAVAQENAAANGVADRVEFRRGDLLEPLQGEVFDAIVSNPPYIPEPDWRELMPEVRCWEPRLALTPGADGLLFYRKLAAEGPHLLRPGGLLAVEVGIGQAGAVRDLFQAAGLSVTIHTDTAGIERAVIGRLGNTIASRKSPVRPRKDQDGTAPKGRDGHG